MTKCTKPVESLQFALSKQTRREAAQVRARWSTNEIQKRRNLAALLQRHLSFIAMPEIC